MTTTIKLEGATLTDGSQVYNVKVSQGDQTLDFPCPTRHDAVVLVGILYGAVWTHTNEEATRVMGLMGL